MKDWRTGDTMLPAQMEFFAREHQARLLEEAQQRHLLKAITAQPARGDTTARRVRYWLGTHLVAWGFQLQGYHTAALAQLPERKSYNY